MYLPFRSTLVTGLLIILFSTDSLSQEPVSADTTAKYTVISAGPQYKTSGFHQFLWGTNYRKEWSTPIKLRVLLLENEKGGLIPQKAGGGNQTTSLHLETKDKKDYTLRSVDKRLGKVLPKEFLGTFLEDIVNDKVSMSNPYAAVTIPVMAEAAGIYHTKPEFVYLPQQAALDTFNEVFANDVYLFEQRIKGSWENAENFGNFDKFYGTYEMMEKLFDETENRVDQKTFLKSRLFDMYIGDWDRHEDQWEWGIREVGDKKIFVPLPQDRDQAYFKHNGVLLDAAIFFSGLEYFQSFKSDVGDVRTFNFEQRGIDRLFTNELTWSDWQLVAQNLQASLTDNVIETAVKKFPPEIFAISGNKIIAVLKERRGQILDYTKTYYDFIAKEVEITGTTGSEYFEAVELNDEQTTVKLFNKTKEGEKKSEPFYSRVFNKNETREIRLFGLGGEDVYRVDGGGNSEIKIRIIGGIDPDSIVTKSATGDAKIHVYDNRDNYIETNNKTRVHFSNDTSLNSYHFRNFKYDKKGLKPVLFFNDPDRLFVGLGYGIQHHNWRVTPYVYKQYAAVNYSISQKAFNFIYRGLFPHAIFKSTLDISASYDLIRWTNFYGLGNETLLTTDDRDYNRVRTKEFNGSLGLVRKFGKNAISLTGFFQTVKVINDTERFTAKILAPVMPSVFDQKNFAGATLNYNLSSVDNPGIPTSGITFNANLSFTQNVKETDLSFWRYGSKLQLYIPLFYKFSVATSAGVSSVSGDLEFYQYPTIGGGDDLRGFRRQRFYGNTTFYNSNELRFLTDLKSYLLNGKIGLVAFVDEGRVWLPQEKSDTWHVGYGGGILLAPFNTILFNIVYALSDEATAIQLRLTANF